MAIKPGIRSKTSKNPAILSHEFVIQNHADIVSCIAMVFVVGLMLQATSSVASLFISLHHNVTGADPSQENPRGELYSYVSGFKDYFAIFFYTLICIIMHAILQEYVLDKISKKLHLSKFKLNVFNESGQLVVFHAMSFLWGFQVIIREGYLLKYKSLWEGFPDHPMSFLHKLFFIIQLAYYLHMLPELYFQRVKQEDQQPKIIYAITGFSIVAVAYFLSYQRIALVLLTVHYLAEFISNIFTLIGMFDREEKLSKLSYLDSLVFIAARGAAVTIGVVTLYFGLTVSQGSARGLLGLGVLGAIQAYLVLAYFAEAIKARRERGGEVKQTAAKKAKSVKSEKPKKKKESDLPEADQSPRPSQGKVKSK